MSQELKKIDIALPHGLLNETVKLADIWDCSVDDIVVKSLKAYVEKCKKIDVESLKIGYGEAAEFNLEYAEMCLCADNQALTVCEEKLSESE